MLITSSPLPVFLKAPQEPSASAGSTATPASETLRSARGQPNRWTSPGMSFPAEPKTLSTASQPPPALCPTAYARVPSKRRAPHVNFSFISWPPSVSAGEKTHRADQRETGPAPAVSRHPDEQGSDP